MCLKTGGKLTFNKFQPLALCDVCMYLWDTGNFMILRETNFGDSRSSKIAIFAILGALNFDFYEFLHVLKAGIYQISKIKISKFQKFHFT